MTVETATYPPQLNTAWPLSADMVSEGDNHIRLTKTVVKTTFPNVAGAVSASHTELNYVTGVTSGIQGQLNGKGSITGQTWTGAHVFSGSAAVPTLAQGTNTTGAASTAFVQAEWATRLPNYSVPITASSVELNYSVGVTSGIQGQINAKGAIAGQTWSGTHDYTAGTLRAATLPAGTATTEVATTAHVASTAFAAALPGQSGNSGKIITTDGTNASWASSLAQFVITTLTSTSLNGGQYSGERNRVRNGAFLINQRVVSGTVTLAAGAYGHDGWKAGSGGCTYTFASSGGITTLTITAGTLLQVVDGVDLVTGTYVLSWTGTAQGRIASGSYAASPVSASVTGGSNTNIEFGTGTLSLVQLERGTSPTTFEHQKLGTYLRNCQRYFCKSFDAGVAPASATGFLGGALTISTQVSAANNFVASGSFPVTMRANPTITTYNPSVAGSGFSASGAGDFSAALFAVGTSGIAIRCTSSVGSAETVMTIHYTASAEL